MKQHIISFCYALVVLLWCTSVHSQDILWEKSLGGKHADYLFDAVPTADYGFLLAGSSLSGKTGLKTNSNQGNLDYWLWKMNEKGELIWQKNFGGTSIDLLQSVTSTNDGGFILGGTSSSNKNLDKNDSIRGLDDFWIIKINALGEKEWQRTIGGSGQEKFKKILNDKDGGYILAGSSSSNISGEKTSNSFGNLDYWIIKTDDKGIIIWQKTFGGILKDELKDINLTNDGGYILGGYSNSPISGNKNEDTFGEGDYWIIKIDSKGEIEWQKTIGGEKDDQLEIVLQTFDKNYILGGNSNSGINYSKNKANLSGTDIWILKLDENGNIIWKKIYDFGKIDVLTSMIEVDKNSVLVGGYFRDIKNSKTKKDLIKKFDSEKSNYIIFKISDIGDEIWRREVGSEGQDVLKKAFETRDGGYLLAGTSNGIASRDKKGSIGNNDFWIVKMLDKEKPKKNRLPIEAIPNPATEFTNIIIGYEYKIGKATLVDLAGHVLQEFKITEQTIPIDLRGYADGIYIVNINTDVQNSGTKVIKVNKSNK